MNPPRHRTLKRLLLALLVLALGGYLLLPGLVGYGLQQWLRDQGYDEVGLAGVDLEPFAGELRLRGLHARHGEDPPLALDEAYANIDWLLLPGRKVRLQGLVLDGLELTLQRDRDGKVWLSGLPLPATAASTDKAPPWGFGIDHLAIRDSRLQLRQPGIDRQLRIDSLVLDGLRSWDADHPATLAMDLRLDSVRLRLDGRLLPFATTPDGRLQLRLDSLDLSALAGDLHQALPRSLPPDLQLQTGQLDAQLQLDARLTRNGPTLEQRGSVTLRDLALTVAGQPQSLQDLHWQGRLSWHADRRLQLEGILTAATASLQVGDSHGRTGKLQWQGRLDWNTTDGLTLQGPLSLQDLALRHQGRDLQLHSLNWEGRLSWSATLGPQAVGSLQAGGLQASQPARKLLLARVAQLHIPALQLDPQGLLALDSMTLQAPLLLQAGDDQPPLLQAARLELGASRLQPGQRLSLGNLTLDGARLDITRGKDGGLPVLQQLATAPPAGQTPPAAEAAATAPLQLALAGLTLSGDSRVMFHDLGTNPPFHQQLMVEKLQVGALDSATPKRWTPLTLAGRLGEYSRIDLSGRARPFARRLNLELKGKLQRLDLPPLSGYTAQQLGYNLQSGQLDADLDIRIHDDQLNGDAKLLLNKLTVKPADADRLAQLTRELGMPLDSALNMLRDGDDNIRLKLPVSGDIHQPDFDLSNLINKAMGKALKTAAISYVKYALQPYGALITLAQLAGKAADRLALSPLPFSAGSAVPDEASAPYLGKLSTMLTERPQLRLQICGLASEADRVALQQAATGTATGNAAKAVTIDDQALLTLAEQRAAAIKRHLVALGTAPERLFLCKPQLDPAADAAPRAKLLL